MRLVPAAALLDTALQIREYSSLISHVIKFCRDLFQLRCKEPSSGWQFTKEKLCVHHPNYSTFIYNFSSEICWPDWFFLLLSRNMLQCYITTCESCNWWLLYILLCVFITAGCLFHLKIWNCRFWLCLPIQTEIIAVLCKIISSFPVSIHVAAHEIRSMVGTSSRTSCRQLFKELNILTVASLYILEVTRFIRKYCQSLELNSNVHNYNTRRKMDIHI